MSEELMATLRAAHKDAKEGRDKPSCVANRMGEGWHVPGEVPEAAAAAKTNGAEEVGALHMHVPCTCSTGTCFS